MSKTQAAFGLWTSPIDASLIAGKARRLGEVQAQEGAIWWAESRLSKAGGIGLMRAQLPVKQRGDGTVAVEEMLPETHSSSTHVHEYGGASFHLTGDAVFFVNSDDGDVHRLRDGRVERITEAADTLFADMQFVSSDDALFCVAERRVDGGGHPENFIARVCVSSGAVTETVVGHDFFGQLRLSDDGTRLAWIAWDLPDMPWHQATLYSGTVEADGIGSVRAIAGGAGAAVFQPEWQTDGSLQFVSDVSGHGALYRWAGDAVEPVSAGDGEMSRPLWNLSMRSHATLDDGTIGVTSFVDGQSVFHVDGAVAATEMAQFSDPVAVGDRFAGLASFHAASPAVVTVDVAGHATIVRAAADLDLNPEMISRGEIVRYPGAHGADVSAIYYAPQNAKFEGPDGVLPPAIITAHGGPTGMADRGLKFKTQYWTSRGFGVLDVDYSGSSGYGRAYRERLDGQWGVRDVADVVAGAAFLAESGRADGAKLAISGGSAGGYTVLMALATTDVFAAGACHYGISDLALLLKFTHKFEAGYLYSLLGVTPDDWEETFAARSPLNLVSQMTSPTIFFQGADDIVVPPEQSQAMVAALKAKGVPVAYHEFEGERHGFRKPDTVATVLAAELAFYQRHLGLVATG